MLVIRTVHPTDLVALMSFEGRACRNEAKTRDRLEKEHSRPLAVGTLLERWLALENRHTLVAAEGLAIHGLVSARHRAGRSTWEVDWLVSDQGEHDEEISAALLDHLAKVGVEVGVQRIFLRLPAESPVGKGAHRAGFWPYVSEVLHRREPTEAIPAPPEVEGLRPCMKGVEHALFRLYLAAVPQGVRAVEGMTLEEWCEAQEANVGRRREYGCLRGDQLWAWLRVTRSGGWGQLQLLVRPQDEAKMSPLVQYGLYSLGKAELVLALVPDFQLRLQSVLAQDWGFEAIGRYHTFVRQLTVRVREARLVPARA